MRLICLSFIALLFSCSGNYFQERLEQGGYPAETIDKLKKMDKLKLVGRVGSLAWLHNPLTELDVDSSDYDRLGRLPETLKKLSLRNTRLTALDGIARLENLERLTIDANTERLDLSKLQGHPSLQSISLANVTLIDGAWPDLPALVELKLFAVTTNQLPDWKKFPKLEKLELDLREGKALGGLPDGLTHLSLIGYNGNRLPDLPGSLTSLSLEGGTVRDFSNLPASLVSLSARSCRLLEAPRLGELSKLAELHCEGQMTRKLLTLLAPKASAITKITLVDMDLDTLADLKPYTRLHDLTLTRLDNLSSFSFPQSIQLARLAVDQCYIVPEAFAEISRLKTLHELRVADTRATVLDLTELSALQRLELGRNQELTEVTGLASLTSLQHMTLSYCPQLFPTKTLEQLPALVELIWEGESDLGLGLAEVGSPVRMAFRAGVSRALGLADVYSLSITYPRTDPPTPYDQLSAVARLKGLEKLELVNVSLDNLVPLRELEQLETVDLSASIVVSLKGLPESVTELGLGPRP